MNATQLATPRKFIFWTLKPSKASQALAALEVENLRGALAEISANTIGEQPASTEERELMLNQLQTLTMRIGNAKDQLRAIMFLSELSRQPRLSVQAFDMAAVRILKISRGE